MLFLEKPEKDRRREGIPMRESLRRVALLRNNSDPRRNGLVKTPSTAGQRIEKKNRVSMDGPSSSSSS